jgi:hypothetical protein
VARFLYVAYSSDDLDSSVDALRTLGLVEVWRGRHAHFATEAVLCAAQRGGIMVIANSALVGESADATAPRHASAMLHIAVSALPDGVPYQPVEAHTVHAYDGPLGPSRMLEFGADGGRVLVEIVAGNPSVGSGAARSLRIENTPYVAESLEELELIFASMGLGPSIDIGTMEFPTLHCRSRAVLMEDWHFIELNAPTGDGPMREMLTGLGGAALFGLNLEPAAFDDGEVPIDLPVVLHGKDLTSHRIVTISPRRTGGALIFKVQPVSFPWKDLRDASQTPNQQDSGPAPHG